MFYSGNEKISKRNLLGAAKTNQMERRLLQRESHVEIENDIFKVEVYIVGEKRGESRINKN